MLGFYRWSALILLTFSSAIADAVVAPKTVSLYGIELGAPLKVGACSSPQTEMCYQAGPVTLAESLLPPKPGEVREFTIYFASGGMPRIASSRTFSVSVSDGVVQSITIFTTGMQSQRDALEQLVGKFGKPMITGTDKVQNGFGAQYEKIVAQWDVGGNYIQLSGFTDTITDGMITAMTSVALKRLNQQRRPEPKL